MSWRALQGIRPAARIMPRNSDGRINCPCCAPAAVEMLSLISVPPRSFTPAVSSNWDIREPSLTHDACTFGIQLFSMMRAMACIFTTSIPVGPGAHVGHQILQEHGRFGMDETQRNELGNPAGLLLYASKEGHVVGQLRRCLLVPEHHRGSGGNAQVMRRRDYLDPLVNGDASLAKSGRAFPGPALRPRCRAGFPRPHP